MTLECAVGALGLQVIAFWGLIIGMNRRIRALENAGAESLSVVVVEEQMPLTGCPRCARGDYGTARRPDGVRHRPTRRSPSLRRLQASSFDPIVEATDGCEVAPTSNCRHGHSSWLRALGIV
jgi:hypothetical protein